VSSKPRTDRLVDVFADGVVTDASGATVATASSTLLIFDL
jgi:hypothetical protein